MWRSLDLYKEGTTTIRALMDSNLQAVIVEVTLGDTPVTILSVYIPSNNHLTSRDLTHLTRNIRGQILITGDFNGHSYLWGSHDVDIRIETTLSDESYLEEGVPAGGVLAVTCFGLKINELPSCIAKDIFKTLCRWPGDLFSRTPSGHHRETSTAGSECHREMGDKEWLQVCSPQVHSCTFYCTLVSGSETPPPPLWGLETLLPVEESTKILGLWWDSHLSFKKHISVLKTQCKEALNLIRVVAHLKWGGDRHSWCCTVPLLVPSLTMVALCMAHHQTPTYNNWTAYITLD